MSPDPRAEALIKSAITTLLQRDPTARARLTDWLLGDCNACETAPVVTSLDEGEDGSFCSSCIKSMVEEVKGDRRFEESRA